jgi:uncharacterized protein (AIM24 family)
VRNVLFGGEGVFLAKLRGPGRAWVHSVSLPVLAGILHLHMPKTR